MLLLGSVELRQPPGFEPSPDIPQGYSLPSLPFISCYLEFLGNRLLPYFPNKIKFLGGGYLDLQLIIDYALEFVGSLLLLNVLPQFTLGFGIVQVPCNSHPLHCLVIVLGSWLHGDSTVE